MNDNGDIRDDLSALIDGALDQDRQREVEAALENDSALRAEYERLIKMNALYAALPREAAPGNFAEGVHAAIARRENMDETGEQPQSPMKFRMFTRAPRSVFWPVAAAATLLAGFFLWTTVNTANRTNTMLSMNKAAAPAKAADMKAKDDQLYKVRVMPEEKTKAEALAAGPAPVAVPGASAPAAAPAPEGALAPAAPAPAQEPSKVETGKEASASGGVQPPGQEGMPQLQELRKEYRDSVLSKMHMAKKGSAEAPPASAAPVAPEPVPAAPPAAQSNAPAPPAPPLVAAEPPAVGAAAPPTAPAQENAAEQRRVAGRVFLRTDTGWVDQAYKGEVLTELLADSDEYKGLLPTHPPLEKVAELGGAITLRIDGVWRDLKTGRPVTGTK